MFCTFRQLGGLVFLGCLGVLCARAGQPEAPCLLVEPESFDVGLVEAGSRNPVVFNLHSLSDHPVRLAYIAPECDCALEMPFNGVVPAGSLFVLAGIYTAPGGSITGVLETLTIFTDCESQRQLKLHVVGVVRSPGKNP